MPNLVNRLRRPFTSIWRRFQRRFRKDRRDFNRTWPTPLRWVKRIFRRATQPEASVERSAFLPPKNEHHGLGWKDLVHPLNWGRWSGGFFLNWLVSRPYMSLFAAAPAIACGAGIATVFLFSTNRDTSKRASNYRIVFDEAVRSNDLATASIAIGSLIDSSPENPDLQYYQAVVEHLQGKTEAAEEHMQALVRERKHGRAAMWLLSKTCDLQSLTQWSKDEHSRFRELIEIGLSNLDEENLLSAKVLMFSYLAEIGALGEASRYLSEVVPARPELSLAAATLCRSQHDAVGKAKYALIAERYFEAELSKQPRDVNTRINLARALMIQQKFEAAAKLLNDGYRLTGDRRLTTVVGEALVIWSDHLGENDSDSKNLVKRLQILSAAVKLAPEDVAVSKAIMLLLTECRRNQSAKVIKLREEILSGTDAVSSEFIRGTLALLDGKLAKGKSHLELAAQHEPGIPAILNNLAVAISASEGGDLEQALTFANTAVEKLPKHPYFLETRGQILLKLRRPQDAILDLEVALQAEELRPAIYPSLARAYEELGSSNMTQMYRELASKAR
jgi:predicted Zn-dependent protease